MFMAAAPLTLYLSRTLEQSQAWDSACGPCIHLATAVLVSIWLEHRPNTQVLLVLCHSQPEGNGYPETV